MYAHSPWPPYSLPTHGGVRSKVAVRSLRQRALDEYMAHRELREADANASWHPTRRARDLDRDPDPEYDFY